MTRGDGNDSGGIEYLKNLRESDNLRESGIQIKNPRNRCPPRKSAIQTTRQWTIDHRPWTMD
jgi:hypothetical protein